MIYSGSGYDFITFKSFGSDSFYFHNIWSGTGTVIKNTLDQLKTGMTWTTIHNPSNFPVQLSKKRNSNYILRYLHMFFFAESKSGFTIVTKHEIYDFSRVPHVRLCRKRPGNTFFSSILILFNISNHYGMFVRGW